MRGEQTTLAEASFGALPFRRPRTAWQWVKFGLRSLVAPLHRRPDFFIIGGMKCATTSLFYSLKGHPQIATSAIKETFYFSAAYDAGLPLYLAEFPWRWRCAGIKACGEGSVDYLANPSTPERLHEFCPEARLILLVRNPVRRALSQFRHLEYLHKGTKPILNWLREEAERVRRLRTGEEEYTPEISLNGLLWNGLYAYHLERWLEFFPNEQLFIRSSEELHEDEAAVLRDVCSFLGVDADYPFPKGERYKVSGKRAAPPDEVLAFLEDYFAEPNEAFFRLTGRRFEW